MVRRTVSYKVESQLIPLFRLETRGWEDNLIVGIARQRSAFVVILRNEIRADVSEVRRSIESRDRYTDVFPRFGALQILVADHELVVAGFEYVVDGEFERRAFKYSHVARARPCWFIFGVK